jgi:hypothetical protein
LKCSRWLESMGITIWAENLNASMSGGDDHKVHNLLCGQWLSFTAFHMVTTYLTKILFY